jgi:hypothetical protein
MQSQESLIATARFATEQAAGLAPLQLPHNMPLEALDDAARAYRTGSSTSGADITTKLLPNTVTISVRNFGLGSVWVGAAKCPPFATTQVDALVNSTLPIIGSDQKTQISSVDVGNTSITGPSEIRLHSMTQAYGKAWSQVVRNNAGSNTLRVWNAFYGVPWHCIASTTVAIALIAVICVLIVRAARRR